MKSIVLTDQQIVSDHKPALHRVLNSVGTAYSSNTNLGPEYHVVPYNPDRLSWDTYMLNDEGEEWKGIDKNIIASDAKELYGQHRTDFDHITYIIHDDNWGAPGLLGWNIAKDYSNYQTHQVRFRPSREERTAGTLYHEYCHSHDQFIYQMTGASIRYLLELDGDFDDLFVHGKHELYDYIRKPGDNIEGIVKIAHLLEQSYQKRRRQAKGEQDTLRQIIVSMEQLVQAYRRMIALQGKEDVPFIDDKGQNQIINLYA